MSSTSARFVETGREKAENTGHRRHMLKVIRNYDEQVQATQHSQFIDWQVARTRAEAIKNEALERLPELLVQFESQCTKNGAKVLWAADAEEARQQILEIVRRHGAKRVVKSKSMTTEELHLNQTLESVGVDVIESDLGELIQQLSGERPYHIVTPCMHKSIGEISNLFSAKLGTPPTTDAEQLTLAAREFLRQRYLDADIGITGANFLIAETGAISITENEGNARLTVSCPPVHIAIAGIEKILPRLVDLELFLPLLATSGTGQRLTVYNSIIRGPRKSSERDGPSEMYVILLDNGRTSLYQDQQLREALRCIRCGACLNACPVYKTVGGHSYDTTYPGPIGAVITPHLKDFQEWHHLSYASSLCGACTDVCPVRIPLHHLLLENRKRLAQLNQLPLIIRLGFRVWAWASASRGRTELLRVPAQLLIAAAQRILPLSPRNRLRPLPAKKSFAAQWKAQSAGQSETRTGNNAPARPGRHE
jgi:L-lactate dehydrogenase complex protein LldF